MGTQSRAKHKPGRRKGTRAHGRSATRPGAQPAIVVDDPGGRLDLEGGDVAPSPFDDPPCGEPVSFIEEGPGAAAPDQGVSEFVEPPEASELSEPPQCP